jgi:heat-inducible transcriptional repressor
MKLARKDEILKHIVEEFIQTAQPVGSKALLQKYDLNCSSATIRNTMAELEKEGMLEKTHISSGRVPSAKGYQYYLDHLDNSSLMNSVDMEFQREFQEVLKNRSKSVEDVVAKSCQMLSEMTNMATVVLGSKASDESLVSIQLLRLTDKTAMGIFITDSGYVEKKTFVVNSKDVTFQQLTNAIGMLNERLAGTKIIDLEAKLKALQPIVTKMYGTSGDVIIQAFLESIVNFTRKRYEVYGEKNLLSLPEFSSNKETFLNAFEALRDPNSLEKNFSEKDDLGNVNIAFTNANKGDFAIVSKQFNGDNSLAVVGPKRMDYKKVLSALEYIVYMLDRYYFSSAPQSTSLVPVSPVEDIAVAKPTRKRKTTTKKGAKK